MKQRIVQLKRELRSLAEDSCGAETRERERIACLLHDEVGSRIFHIGLKLGEWRKAGSWPAEGAAGDLTALLAQLAQTVRMLTLGMAPPAWHGGLLPALEAVACELGLCSGLDVCVEGTSQDFDVPELQRALVCRIVRELCFNVHKHAQARRVEIAPRLEGGWLCVRVQDDGQGLCPAASPAACPAGCQGGLGLASACAQLRALGGELELRSEPGRGTCARVLLPVVSA